MNRLLGKFFWVGIGVIVFYFLSFLGINVRGSTIGGVLFVGAILLIYAFIQNMNT